MTQLPEGFADLERFVPVWALDDFQKRFEHRCHTDYSEIQAFYEATLPRAGQAIAHLEQLPLDALHGRDKALYQLLMALAHAALAVERHGQARPKAATFPTNLAVIQAALPD